MSALCLTDLDRPSLRDRDKSPCSRDALDDFEVDAEVGERCAPECGTCGAGTVGLARAQWLGQQESRRST